MVRRPTPRRQSRGFTLLLALGVVAVVTMAVMLSYSVVGREADTQSDTRRQKQAFFAAEAGLAEGRETIRLMLNNNGNSSTMSLPTALGGGVPVEDIPALAAANPPWYELLPGPTADKWNRYTLLKANLSASELPAGVDYPEQNNVRYRVFVRDDVDDDQNTVDSNRQMWVLAVGEVTTATGRPTRSMVQALVTNATGESIFAPGCITKGCGPDMTYNNPTDINAPTGTTITLP
ncbi:hypothetical protein HJC10_39895 [Corallococcus exiguus]|uniref:hypothetical protein n=1 Tax=Corallococcus TaxID=83461 RepID=UPI000EE31238|nr:MULTISPECIES: hypothetical protein [Corallococcus]NNB93100.1 hypothetical protein [Corallococcus exiguus]NNC08977.1 hypothetical protein [Corallococcus exiguus]NPC45612.1 hypothetical protein [Corallococcus exiguus]RKH87143.1 hypothetical protein D7X99_01770 [Corallococcus sp. AB032C]